MLFLVSFRSLFVSEEPAGGKAMALVGLMRLQRGPAVATMPVLNVVDAASLSPHIYQLTNTKEQRSYFIRSERSP